MVLLTLSVSVIPLDYRKAIFFVALYILSVGEGGHKPCVQTFAADQFDEDSLEDKKVKSSFFNWWFFGIVAGSSSAILAVIYVEVKICGKCYTYFIIKNLQNYVAINVITSTLTKKKKNDKINTNFTLLEKFSNTLLASLKFIKLFGEFMKKF